MNSWTTPQRQELPKSVRTFAERERIDVAWVANQYRDMRILGIGGGTTGIMTSLAAKTLGYGP
jgi:acyl-CoA dehydrogenase